MPESSLVRLAVALGIGLLVGLQREWATDRIAGIRTFPLIAIAGALSGMLADELGAWIPAAGLIAVAAMFIMANFEDDTAAPGITTEMAALVVFLTGVAVGLGWTVPAIAAGGTVVVLLQAKGWFHDTVARFGEADLKAVAQLALIGMVILPAMPDVSYGPSGVINPYEIWLMVVLIVGISLVAYMVYKFYGAKAGVLLGGVLGGLISSTASTLTYATDTRQNPKGNASAAVMIMIASTVVFGRVIAEIAVVTPGSFGTLAPPLFVMMVGMIGITGFMYGRAKEAAAAPAPEEPPTSLKAAISFGLLYAVVLVAVAVAQERFDDSGLYLVAFLSGLTDMDAITLSTAQLVDDGAVADQTGWRMILVGGMSNLVFKGGIVASVGDRGLFKLILQGFGASLLVGATILLLWS